MNFKQLLCFCIRIQGRYGVFCTPPAELLEMYEYHSKAEHPEKALGRKGEDIFRKYIKDWGQPEQ